MMQCHLIVMNYTDALLKTNNACTARRQKYVKFRQIQGNEQCMHCEETEIRQIRADSRKEKQQLCWFCLEPGI